MRMLIAAVDLQLGRHLAAHLGLRQHTFDRLLDNCLRLANQQLRKLFLAQSARIARVAAIQLLLALQPCQNDLLCVYHHNMVARIDIRRVLCAVLARKHSRCSTSQAAQRLTAGIHYKPLAIDVLHARYKSRHNTHSEVLLNLFRPAHLPDGSQLISSPRQTATPAKTEHPKPKTTPKCHLQQNAGQSEYLWPSGCFRDASSTATSLCDLSPNDPDKLPVKAL